MQTSPVVRLCAVALKKLTPNPIGSVSVWTRSDPKVLVCLIAVKVGWNCGGNVVCLTLTFHVCLAGKNEMSWILTSTWIVAMGTCVAFSVMCDPKVQNPAMVGLARVGATFAAEANGAVERAPPRPAGRSRP